MAAVKMHPAVGAAIPNRSKHRQAVSTSDAGTDEINQLNPGVKNGNLKQNPDSVHPSNDFLW